MLERIEWEFVYDDGWKYSDLSLAPIVRVGLKLTGAVLGLKLATITISFPSRL